MPRLPTIRVIGSQAISTRPLPSPAAFVVGAICVPCPSLRGRFVWGGGRSGERITCGGYSPRGSVSGGDLVSGAAPLGLLVHRLGRDRPQLADHGAVRAAGVARHLGAGGLVHERHELV